METILKLGGKMVRKTFALVVSCILSLGMLIGIGSQANATPDKQLTFEQDEWCASEGEYCNFYFFEIKMKELFGSDGNPYTTNPDDDISFQLFNSSGKRVYSDNASPESATDWGGKYESPSYRGMVFLDEGKQLAKGKYTLRVTVKTADEEEQCGWYWNHTYTDVYNPCADPDYSGPERGATHHLTYTFNWYGKAITANRQSFTGSAKKTESTQGTYTATKSASYTGTAQYTSKQTAKFKHKGKTYKASSSATSKKTHKITKTATVKKVNLKKTATATAKMTSFHSIPDAEKMAAKKASKEAKSKANSSARSATSKEAQNKAKSLITKKVKDDANKKAKSKITNKTKSETQKKAYNEALKLAKKKAGVR